MNLYDECKMVDIIGPIRQYLDQGLLRIEEPERVIRTNQRLFVERTWLFGSFPQDRQACSLWHRIYFQIYGIIPRACFGCWKVVLRMRKFSELMTLLGKMGDIGVPGKCGPEARDYTGWRGTYASFWYSPLTGGLEGGRATFHKVRDGLKAIFGDIAVADWERSGQLILKRGCTEMELRFGPSDKWEHNRYWNLIEDLADTLYRVVEVPETELAAMKSYVIPQWIDFAMAFSKVSGDLSWQQFTDHRIEPPVTYERSIHSPKDFVVVPRDASLNDTIESDEEAA